MPVMRLITWNINGGVIKDRVGGATLNREEVVDYLALCLRRLRADVVALQEVPFFENEENGFITEVAEKAGYKFCIAKSVSASHLHENAKLGLAILSVHPLDNETFYPLPNPELTFQRSDGTLERSHDKAFLSVNIKSSDLIFSFFCGHLIPFRDFNRHPGELLFNSLKKELKKIIGDIGNKPAVICADINTDSIYSLIPEMTEKFGLRELIKGPTKHDGHAGDQIFCSRHWHEARSRTNYSGSDHYICMAELSTAPSWVENKSTPIQELVSSSAILHLSDLHFGEGTIDDVDWKVFIDLAERETRTDRLSEYLNALPRTPDYVLISGDFTIAGQEKGFKEFGRIIDKLISEKKLPEVDRFIVVPGNHDVTRKIEGKIADEEERWNNFKQFVGEKFVRPWLPGDPDPKKIADDFQTLISKNPNIIGGVSSTLDKRAGEIKREHYPMLFDRDRGILFYAFNSASVSGTRIKIDAEIEEIIKSLKIAKQNEQLIEKIDNELNRLREVDPARVNPTEINLFQNLTSLVKNTIPDEYDRALKIAVLHHHIAPIFGEEVKQFELILNAGLFKRIICQEGFQMVVHGHKHWPEMFYDTAISGGGKLLVLSGGTIGGAEASKRPGFYWLEYERGRSELSAKFVKLQSDNPRRVFEKSENYIAKIPTSYELESIENKPSQNLRESIGFNLSNLYEMCGTSMLQMLSKQDVSIDGGTFTKVGWSHFLGQPEVTPLATAYGLQIVKILNPFTPRFKSLKAEIAKTLIALRRSNGGWSASALGEPGLPLETATALYAITGIVTGEEAAALIKAFEGIIEEKDFQLVFDSTYAVSTIIQTLLEYSSRSDKLTALVSLLKDSATRDDKGERLYWTRSTLLYPETPGSPEDQLASAVHTAHAISALIRAYKATDGKIGLSSSELRAACHWLLEADWTNSVEKINEAELPARLLTIHHFTAPWAIIALLEAGISPRKPRILSAAKRLWETHDNGLWNFGQLYFPIWAALDGVRALTEFSFRSNYMEY